MPTNALTPFQRALLDIESKEYSDIPSENELPDSFSSGFQNKMEQLVRCTRRNSWYYVNTGFKRAILVAAVVLLLLMSAMAIEPIRNAIIGLFVHNDGVAYSFTFDPESISNAPKEIETVYCPTYLPDGYTEFSRSIAPAGTDLFYMKDDGAYISFIQLPIPENPANNDWMGISSEEVETSYIILDDYQVMRVDGADYTILAWTNHEYFFILDLSGLSELEQELPKVFSGIQVDTNAVIDENG